MLKLILLLALVAMLKCTADAARVTQGGRTGWRVFVPGKSGVVERFACEEPKAGPVMGEYLAMVGAKDNLDRTYRASRCEADDWIVGWLKDMRSMISRAAQLAAGDPIYSYRISKAASGMDMLIRLGPCKSKIDDIEKAIKDGTTKRADVEIKIAEARSIIADLLSYSEKLGALNIGVMDSEWMKGWTINRILTDPLDRAEKSLKGDTKAG